MPPLALLMAAASERSMRWLLDACGVRTAGLTGALRVRGLVAVWLWTVRAWQTDESADLSTTMAALDRALGQAERAAGWLGGNAPVPPPPMPEPPMPEPPMTEPLTPESLTPEPPMPEARWPDAPSDSGVPTAPAEGMPGLEPEPG
jgi:hypothetical protein